MKATFRILRFDPLRDAAPYFQDFPYQGPDHRAVLEALMEVRNDQDCTLAFRYSCREAICGSCGMVINGHFDLACRTTVGSLESPLITIEPLTNLEIQKDLIVDMEPFWKAMEKIQPYLVGDGSPPEKGFRIEDKEMEKIDVFTNCVLCACCYAACPVVSRDERYLGPAALAKFYRFVKDPRDRRPFSTWSKTNAETGVWGCDTVFKCNDVCPKKVRPADGIESLRRMMLVKKMKSIFKVRR